MISLPPPPGRALSWWRDWTPQRAWLVLLGAYIGLYAVLLLATDGYPYVFDNNESYSSLWHARSLYENGVAHTKGLTDEVFSPAPAASPYIHSHQGNFPRLFTFALYALGLRTIGPQIWVTTFTVGLAALWLAFRFFSRLASPAYAVVTCLLLMTDYLFFTQWQVGLYNIWHGFFFFSSLTCVQALDTTERRGRWALLAVLNFAALFYWEYVFTAFVTALCGFYALVLYRRRLPLVGLLAAVMAAGAALAAGTLLLQLAAYMGWAGVLEDVRLTLTARNAAADPALLARVTAFYREHHIIFWHNFLDAAPLRSLAAFWNSLFEFHLKYYSPTLLYSTLVIVVGWLLGCWHWAHRGWRRVLPALLLAGVVLWAWSWMATAPDPELQEQYALTTGGPLLLAGERCLLGLVTLVALACAALGNAVVLGQRTGSAAALVPLLLCAAAAYAVTYRVFTGYIYSGYLHRFVPLPVFLTLPVIGLAFHTLFRASRHAWFPATAHRLLRSVPSALALVALLGVAAYWTLLQFTYARIAPADSYAFLSQLERPPLKGSSLVSNTYPAPMAARTRSWGYADTALFSGVVRLTAQGFETERDLKYLWFADRDTNPAYAKPDLAVFVSQTPNFPEALEHYRSLQGRDPESPPSIALSGLFQRARAAFQPFLRHRIVTEDGQRYAIARLDWDYPPYLQPQKHAITELVRQLNLRQALAISANTGNSTRHWRVEFTPLDGERIPDDAITLLADGLPASRAARAAAAPPCLLLEADQLELRLRRSASGGRVKIAVNGVSEVFDLSSLPESGAAFTWTAARPYGRHTDIPFFPAGFYLQTHLTQSGGRPYANLQYHYAHQEQAPEAASTVRLYATAPDGRRQLLDCVTFLGRPGVPVRLEEFRRTNPDTVAEHARISAAGDARTYEQWLADYLALHPREWDRPGIVAEALPRPGIDGSIVTRRLPLPPEATGQLQFSVTPATRTKAGPEYFGVPFQLASRPEADGPLPLASVMPTVIGDTLPFGRLRLKLRFPLGRWPQSEPLLTTGSNEAGDVIYLIYVDAGHIRLGFDHWFKGGPLSPPIPIDYAREHELDISIGSLYPPSDAVVFYGRPADEVAALKNRVLIRLDGQVVIDAEGSCYESTPRQVTVGENNIRATSAGLRFSGEILATERVWPWAEPATATPP